MTDSHPPRKRTLPLSACVLAYRSDGSILAVQRSDDPALSCMPGGKLEAGETLIETAGRELLEETGVRIGQDNLVEVYRGECEGDQRYDTTVFLAIGASSQPLTPREGEGLAQWVDASVLLDPSQSPFARFNRRALEEAREEVRLLASWMRLDSGEVGSLRALEAHLGQALQTHALQASIAEWVALPRKLTPAMWKTWEETFFVSGSHPESWEAMVSMAPEERVDPVRVPRAMTPAMQAAWEASHNQNDSYQADFDAAVAAAPAAPGQRPGVKGP